MPTRVIITGCRRWYCRELARSILARLYVRHESDLVIVHGAAPGVDSAFGDEATEGGIAVEPHPADWHRYGNGAGPKRNAEMVALGASLCLAVHRDLANSKGTRGCVRLALAAGIPVWLIDSEEGKPRRITVA